MGIADPEAALEKLREFRHLLVTDESALRAGGQQTARVPRSELQPLVEQIARELDPEGVQHLGGSWSNGGQRWTFGGAITEAAKAVELRAQLKVDRRDINGKDLYAQAFSIKEPTDKIPRLWFLHIDKNERPDDWISAHEGAMHLGMGCAQGIRNPQAHPSDDITEQEALEQLATLSVLARWVDACNVVSGADDAAGE